MRRNLTVTTAQEDAPPVGSSPQDQTNILKRGVLGLDVTQTPSPKALHRSLASSSARFDFGGHMFRRKARAGPRLTPVDAKGTLPAGPPLRTGANPPSAADAEAKGSEAQDEVAALRASLAAEKQRNGSLQDQLTELQAALDAERTRTLELSNRVVELERAAAAPSASTTAASGLTAETTVANQADGDPPAFRSVQRTFRARRLSRDIVADSDTHDGHGAPTDQTEATGAVSNVVALSPASSAASSPVEVSDASVQGAGYTALVAVVETDEHESSTDDVQSAAATDDVQAASPRAAAPEASAGALTAAAAAPAAPPPRSWIMSPELGKETDTSQHAMLPTAYCSFSCQGAEPHQDGSGSISKINQDCAGVAYPFAGRPDSMLVCVYDGHGEDGHSVSSAALHATFAALESDSEGLLTSPPAALARAFNEAQARLLESAASGGKNGTPMDVYESGACALVAYLRGGSVWVANAGDCRAVLGTKREGVLSAVALSTDHKPDAPSESARIRECGGYVRPARDDGDDYRPARLFEEEGKPWLGPGLAMSRSLGDAHAHRCGLICTPEVISHCVDAEDDLYLILASDGVWEFLSPAQAVDIVHARFELGMDPTDACRWLIGSAALKWREHEGNYRDDITATVLHLPSVFKSLLVAGADE